MRYTMLIMMLMPSTLIAHMDVKSSIKHLVTSSSNRYNLPAKVVSAIIMVESRNNVRAFVKSDGKSRKESYGLMQLQLSAANMVGFRGKGKELMRPDTNIELGSRYLRWILDNRTHGNMARALVCYNSGPNSMACRSKKSTKYVDKVLKQLAVR